jgi:hypothetical protein
VHIRNAGKKRIENRETGDGKRKLVMCVYRNRICSSRRFAASDGRLVGKSFSLASNEEYQGLAAGDMAQRNCHWSQR